MKKILYFLFLTFLFVPASFGIYNTPGTGVKWNLNDLVTNSGGAVTINGIEFNVNDTVKISALDTLYITSNAIVRFAANTFLSIRGTLIVNPPLAVLFTAINTTNGYLGMRIDTSSATVLRKLIFEYAVSLKISDCNPTIDSCIIQYNNNSASTTFGNGAISLFRANPLITYCKFLNNQRAAIQGGSNINNAPKIFNCLFSGNNTTNQNVPQINLGQTGTDTVRIIHNDILRASTNSGGLGFLPIGTVYAQITGNVIKNNRYGMTFNGGSNINAIVSYNVIDSNNTQNNPNLGGSGIAFTGGSATSQQNTIVTGNLIRWNLWGITIQNRSRPNLGNIINSDTSDNGKNLIYGNTNSTTPFIDLYNNSVDTIYAQNNFWGTIIPDSVEARIFHFPDNNALGPVYYTPFILPVELVSFTALPLKNEILLNWKTATEVNNYGFSVERYSNSKWSSIGFVAGHINSLEPIVYSFKDANPLAGKTQYRLKQMDLDGSFKHSDIVEADLSVPSEFSLDQNYPNPFNPSTSITYSLPVEGIAKLSVYNVIGELVKQFVPIAQTAGRYQVSFDGSGLGSGIYFYSIEVNSAKESHTFTSTKKMVLLK